MDVLIDESSDLVVAGGDLVLDAGLGTAVLVSVFSDARVDPDQSPDGTVRGWWAEADPFGSTLWTHARAKALNSELPAIIQAVEAALQWLITDGIAESIAVQAEIRDRQQLYLEVALERGSATQRASLWGASTAQEYFRGQTTLGVKFR